LETIKIEETLVLVIFKEPLGLMKKTNGYLVIILFNFANNLNLVVYDFQVFGKLTDY
jgi:hypothetical protein